ncbi:hypothetical protein BD324DRAFT_630025 [Kockovaella imperatae]|uniref:Zn(2)-C6 fungal-type domain-containing protein n=1 Tax=Kockovaella imperatae TaxID=4999 RepID=A0A1Y1UDE3_9TREE|nr:hypothetical protein BD324DRAFT_630025 [Kockovaella imperatae]ORX36060.1 hypothetical protein BD324DRAFT_630025 [Kockovaella imperatae]
MPPGSIPQSTPRSPDGSNGEDDRKQAGRACDYCHRMKMKCLGKENPPCNRCRASGHVCTFDGPRKTKSSKVDDRLKVVESQMLAMSSALQELIQLQKASLTPAAPEPVSTRPARGRLRTEGSPRILPQYPPSSTTNTDDELAKKVLSSRAISPWNSMASLAEAARLKYDDGSPSPMKKRKNKHDELHELSKRHSLTGHEGPREPPDPIDLGICDEATARRMYDLFMENCLVYMPCFDPVFDTFESLRRRSAFCITVLVMIGAKTTDAGGPMSELQRRCIDHAERIGMSTLFTPIASMETVQAMVVMASWGDTSWRPGGHATRMAMDLGLYRCLPLLVQSGMGKGKSGQELRAEWPLVEGARVWMTLYKLEQEMAFNLGRPCMIGGTESIQYCRELLKHPLSVQRDARLVAACELLTYRIPLHNPYAFTAAEAALIPDLDAKLERHEKDIADWQAYWDRYYAERGIGEKEFLRQALATNRAGSQLNINTRLLHGVHSPSDVANLPPHRRELLIIAFKAAQTIVSMALRSGQYKKNFRYANLYTHLNVAFAARCLIRLTSLVPEVVDVRQLGKDLEGIAHALTQVPGFQYAELLRQVVLKARRENILPPASPPRETSPDMTAMQFGAPAMQQLPADMGFLDFNYAEQLLNDQPASVIPQGIYAQHDAPKTYTGTAPMDQSYNLDTWFPFPPLDPSQFEAPIDQIGRDSIPGYGMEGSTNGQQWWS